MTASTTPPATAAEAQSRRRGTGGDASDRVGAGMEGVDYQLSPRVLRGARGGSYERRSIDPIYRPLRVYALDPSASLLEGAVAVLNVPYEPLEPGPTGRLLRLVDDGLNDELDPERADTPGAHRIADPLDLEDHRLLVTQGRDPSVTDPAFRAQMAYAVCSTTYAAFRHALGREVTWGFDRGGGPDADRLIVRSCVRDMRNAYYDPVRGELRLGAFTADERVEGRNASRGRVCTALDHDIVVHEMSHALLDGMRARFMYPSNPDVLAFHEAFADIVALFQRFTYRDVVRAAIVGTRGDVRMAKVLTQIGRRFAQTTGAGTALRSALLEPQAWNDAELEPHQRGAVLVAAMFRAFTIVYGRKARPLVRLATNGTGVLPPGQIPDLLADQLAELATKLAGHFLSICIRAIDYCPPLDITFGEYLRAVITADRDLVPDDPWAYREAWIDAFRHYDIPVRDVLGLTQDALRWRGAGARVPAIPRLAFAQLRFDGDPGRPAGDGELREQGRALGALVGDPQFRREFGLTSPGDPRLDGDEVDLPMVESIRNSRRVGPDGQIVFDLVAEVTQRRRVRPRDDAPGFDFYGGATILIDPRGQVRYVVRKSVWHRGRLAEQQRFVRGADERFFVLTGAARDTALPRPQSFRLIHQARRHPPE